MSYCLNPICSTPENSSHSDVCQTCGFALRLKNRYHAIKVIGRGGFGRTLLALDEAQPLKTRCVIKQFLPQPENLANTEKASELFREEVLRLREVGKHPKIPDLVGYCSQGGYQYLIQECIDGCDLAKELTEDGAFSEVKIRRLLEELLPVVQFIHDRHIIHRDIKPANIIRRQSDRSLFLVDLGAAKQTTGTALAQTGTVIGSAEYVSPEQARGRAVFASDIYSLGATCIHLLTGMSPFDLYNSHEGQWVWQEYLPESVSRSLASVLNKMLQNATNKRYDSATQILADISSFERQTTIQSLGDPELVEVLTPERTTAQLTRIPLIHIPGGAIALGKAPEKLIQLKDSPSDEPIAWNTLNALVVGLWSCIVISVVTWLISSTRQSYQPQPPIRIENSSKAFDSMSEKTNAAKNYAKTPEGQEAIAAIRTSYQQYSADPSKAIEENLPRETSSYRYSSEVKSYFQPDRSKAHSSSSKKGLSFKEISVIAMPKNWNLHHKVIGVIAPSFLASGGASKNYSAENDSLELYFCISPQPESKNIGSDPKDVNSPGHPMCFDSIK